MRGWSCPEKRPVKPTFLRRFVIIPLGMCVFNRALDVGERGNYWAMQCRMDGRIDSLLFPMSRRIMPALIRLTGTVDGLHAAPVTAARDYFQVSIVAAKLSED